MYRTRSVGVELLSEAFDEFPAEDPRGVAVESTPEWVPLGEGIRRPESGYRDVPIAEIEEALDDLNGSEVHQRELDTWRTASRDVLAWYAPYTFHGSGRWGIYYNDPVIDVVVARTALEMLPSTPDVSLADVGTMVRRVIRAHELVHFSVEAAAAVLTLDEGRNCYAPTFGHGGRVAMEEQLATAVEIATPHRWRSGPYRPAKRIRDAFAAVWEEIVRPYPYSDWQVAARDLPLAVDDLTDVLAGRRLGQLIASMFELAPSGYTPSRVPEFHRSLRFGSSMAFSTLRRPALQLVRKHAHKNIKKGRPSGARWEPSSGGNHPVKLKGPHMTIPIPVKHDRIDDRVLSQLAAFFGVTKAEYLEELRALS